MTSSTVLLILVVMFFVVIAGQSYHIRQRERMRRGKAILDRFSPERSKKPLGL
jgi:hypothetical protein